MRKKTIIIIGIIIMLEIGGIVGISVHNNSVVSSYKSTQASDANKVIAEEKAKAKLIDSTNNAYMKKNNLTLKAKDVQFNMKNNLDKDFAITGTAHLSDYYNFGFTDDETYFCIQLDTDDSLLDSWYLYCNRVTFSELFNDLQNGHQLITATCVIPESLYESNRGNLARVTNVERQ